MVWGLKGFRVSMFMVKAFVSLNNRIRNMAFFGLRCPKTPPSLSAASDKGVCELPFKFGAARLCNKNSTVARWP